MAMGLAAPVIVAAPASASGQVAPPASSISGERRRLADLEVSAVGLGVQNMHRTYPTTIPIDRRC